MTPTLQLTNGNILTISPTQLNTIKSCPRQWWFNYIYRRVRAGAFAARDGGKAFDAAMNRRYSTLGSRAAAGTVVEDLMLQDIDDGFAGLDLPLEEYRTAARYKEVVQAYNEHYRDEPFEVLAVQMPFEVEVGRVRTVFTYEDTHNSEIADQPVYRDITIHLHGILDLLVRDRTNGMVWVVDTKTSNKWDSRQQASYDNHLQMKAYAWAVPRIRQQAIERGIVDDRLALLPERVHGCMINAVVIKPPYKSEKYAASAKATARNEFHRFVVNYSEERLEEWRQDTLQWCEMALGWVARGQFPQNEAKCAHHYGGKCPWIDVCTIPEEQREMALASDMFQDYRTAPALENKPLDNPFPAE